MSSGHILLITFSLWIVTSVKIWGFYSNILIFTSFDEDTSPTDHCWEFYPSSLQGICMKRKVKRVSIFFCYEIPVDIWNPYPQSSKKQQVFLFLSKWLLLLQLGEPEPEVIITCSSIMEVSVAQFKMCVWSIIYTNLRISA